MSDGFALLGEGRGERGPRLPVGPRGVGSQVDGSGDDGHVRILPSWATSRVYRADDAPAIGSSRGSSALGSDYPA